MEKRLALVMKNASTAIYLDSENRLVDAYVQYLQCLSSIASQLLENAAHIGHELEATKPIRKYVQLGQQCMERISIILDKLGQNPSHLERRKSDTSNTAPDLPGTLVAGSNSVGAMPGAPVPFVQNPAVVSPLEEIPVVTPSLMEEPRSSYRKPAGISPMDMAYRYNKQLLNAYRSRTARMNHAAASTLSLTVQRKMAENLAIAKRQEAALEKKMKERQQRLEEQATRRFSVPTGMSKKEQEQRHTYKQILEYEQDMKWLAKWRSKLEENPKDAAVIHNLISEILRCADHPLTLLIKRCQYRLCQALVPLVTNHMKELEDIRVSIDETSSGVPNIAELLSPQIKGDNSNPLGNSVNTTPKIAKENSESREITGERCKNLSDVEQDVSKSINDLEDGGVEGIKSDLMTPSDVQAQVKTDLETAIVKGDDLTNKLNSNQKTLRKMASQSMDKTVEDYEDEISDEIWGSDDDGVGELQSPGMSSLSSSSGVGHGGVPVRSESTDSTESIDSNTQKWRSLYNQSVLSEDGTMLQSLKNEAYSRHLKWISQDVHSYLEEVQVMFIVAYEKLDSPEGRDQCLASIEEPFFKPIWGYLLALFRLANLPKEHALVEVMSKYHSVLPRDVGVRPKLCLVLPPGESQENYIPYGPAIEELQTLPDTFSPLSKLECLVRVSKCVCQCVEDYYTSRIKDTSKKGPNIGADDLLPILTYVILQSRVPQVVSECQAMEEFIHEGYLMGEEGYCLTSLQTAVNYIVSIHKRAAVTQ